jgi:hypothetical protein
MANDQQRLEFRNLSSSLFVEGCEGGASGVGLIYYPPGGQPAIDDWIVYNFIAADCGDQPRTDAVPTKYWYWLTSETGEWRTWPDPGRAQKSAIATVLPQLKGCEWSVTAQLPEHDGFHWALKDYNCIAWSVDEDNFYYTEAYIAHWYGDLDGTFEPEDMDEFYARKKGWVKTETGTDAEKAAQAEAMYYSGYHAARRKSGCTCGAGRWVMYDSKLGDWERIEHVWNQLNSAEYGAPARFYRAP